MNQEYKLMVDTLRVLARQFRAYESHHAHKGDIEKAESNASFAKLAETVIEMVAWSKSAALTMATTDAPQKKTSAAKRNHSQPIDLKWEMIPEKFKWSAIYADGYSFAYVEKHEPPIELTERDMSTLLELLENPPRPTQALQDDFHAYQANKNPHFQIKKDKQ